MNFGSFLISLDFELMWGVRDVTTIDKYGESIIGVRKSLPKIMRLFDKYDINATVSAVGFLFFDNNKDLLKNIPLIKPKYKNEKLSPYLYIEEEGFNEIYDKYYFGADILKKIKGRHEISTHTYSHYYCLEEGQDINSFEEDLKMAIKIAKINEIELKSIIFPRNQINYEYLKICKKYGITSYRGNQNSWIYQPSKSTSIKRVIRLLDSYFNLSGQNIYDYELLKKDKPLNLPSSLFLRPYNNFFSFMEKQKINRIKKGMLAAAQQNKMFHLWWHPHNFGINQCENLINLEEILSYYKDLNVEHGFKSMSMSELSKTLLK